MEKSINGKILTMGAIALTCMFAILSPAHADADPCDAENAAAVQACQNEGSPECNAAADARSKCLRANAPADSDD